jgi:L-lactate dehydrogenase
LTVRTGEYADLAGARAVLICAGVGQKPGESRLDLLKRNTAVFSEVIPSVLKAAPDAVLIVATNPVDVMTHITAHFARLAGAPASHILGSGTTLDTARYRALLGRHLGVDPHHLHGYVIGEHGDSEVLTWSLSTVAGLHLDQFCAVRGIELTEQHRAEIDEQVRRAAYHIIAGKGSTYYGIGSALARITEAVLGDQRAILTVCTATDSIPGVPGVTLSLPRLVGGEGVLATIPLALNTEEQAALQRSGEILKTAIDSLGL